MQQIQENALLSSYLQGTSTCTCMFKADMLWPTVTLNLTMWTLFSCSAHHTQEFRKGIITRNKSNEDITRCAYRRCECFRHVVGVHLPCSWSQASKKHLWWSWLWHLSDHVNLSGAHHMPMMPLVLVALLHILFGHTFHQTIVVALQQCHCCTAYELSACTAGGRHRWISSVGGLD